MSDFTVDVSAAAPDEREAFERLPERFRFSRKVYGDVADDATRVLLALTDGGHADHPSDYLRWVSIRAAQALASRPAPTVSGERGDLTLADAWDEGWRACAGSAGSASPHHNGPANPYRTVADWTPAEENKHG